MTTKLTLTSILASGLAAMVIGLAAPTAAAPSGGGSAQDTVNALEANGYRVILSKLSDRPLDQATVVAIRPGRQVTQRVTESGGDSVDKVLYTTVYVDVT